MEGQLDVIERQLGRRDDDSPPLHLWHPPLSGDIPIRIAADGGWYHEGVRIQRDSLVKLFASILRREADGEYYLVTPVEKWRIEVELHPLFVIDVNVLDADGQTWLQVVLNTGKCVTVDDAHPLWLEEAVGNVACVSLEQGLTALFSRAAWLRLVDMAEEGEAATVVSSGPFSFSLAPSHLR